MDGSDVDASGQRPPGAGAVQGLRAPCLPWTCLTTPPASPEGGQTKALSGGGPQQQFPHFPCCRSGFSQELAPISEFLVVVATGVVLLPRDHVGGV